MDVLSPMVHTLAVAPVVSSPICLMVVAAFRGDGRAGSDARGELVLNCTFDRVQI
jgi:hypothetical protein